MLYKDYQPTIFDHKGYHLPDRQGWLVAPVGQNRDSGTLARSNFRVVLADLGGESDNVEVHRFGHWGPGWFEIIIVDPSSHASAQVYGWERALEDYPIASEDDHSELHWGEICEYWENASLSDRIEICKDAGISILKARHDYVPEVDDDDVFGVQW